MTLEGVLGPLALPPDSLPHLALSQVQAKQGQGHGNEAPPFPPVGEFASHCWKTLKSVFPPGHYKSNSYFIFFKEMFLPRTELYVPLCYGGESATGFLYNDPYIKYCSKACNNSLVVICEGGKPTRRGLCFTLDISLKHLQEKE